MPGSPTASPSRLPKAPAPPARVGPPLVKLKWGKQSFDLNLDDFSSVGALRVHVQGLTGVFSMRQTLILAGRRLPLNEEQTGAAALPTWNEIRASVRSGATLMM